jgi:hypothetical protein
VRQPPASQIATGSVTAEASTWTVIVGDQRGVAAELAGVGEA